LGFDTGRGAGRVSGRGPDGATQAASAPLINKSKMVDAYLRNKAGKNGKFILQTSTVFQILALGHKLSN
jgi:hypothetical protein